MDTVVATVSGYHGAEKFNIIKLICQSGAGYVGSLNPSISHLVCCKFEGKKYEFARKFNIIVVNHRWIEDCVKQGRRVSERPYMKKCGCVKGPFGLEIPGAAAVSSKTTVIDVESGNYDDDNDGDELWTDSVLVKELRLSDARKNEDRSDRSKRKLKKRSSKQDGLFTNDNDLPESPSYVLRRIENPLSEARQNKESSNRAKIKLNEGSARQDVSLANKYDLPESPSFGLRRIEDSSFFCPTQRVNRTKETTAVCESSKGNHRLMRKNIRDKLKSSSDSEEDFQHTEIHRKDVEIGEPSKYSGRHETRRSYETRHYHPKRRTLILEDSENVEDLDRTKETTAICESSKGNHRLMRKNMRDKLKTSSDSEKDFQHIEIHCKDVEIGEPSKYSGRHETRRSYETRHDHPKRRTLILEDSENVEDLDSSNLHDQPKRRNLILEDSENIEDLGTINLQDPECNEDDSHIREKDPTLSTQVPLSCVICWTEFSSTRGVLPCGHRFCFSCIQNWADHMASIKRVSTCPLCKASFCSIRKMEDAVSSDQKIYSQTLPHNHAAMDVYILPYGQAPTHQMMPPPGPVCYHCFLCEPAELLIRCYSCDLSCVHSYCLDPPQNPWICVQCKDLRMRYVH
uniref:BRCT domain-containing protein At4g02110 n=1 Tax=Erigeron canadensis TaxID=72917 RepID=UPI001CB985DC|nr:BRCT domain-containing protein At4g02110 [Erigeron canadensis]